MSLCLNVWVCLKQGSENIVLVVLLRLGAKDLTVRCLYCIVFYTKLL